MPHRQGWGISHFGWILLLNPRTMRRLENISLLLAMLVWSLGAVTALIKIVRKEE
jgi:hypothetical protein